MNKIVPSVLSMLTVSLLGLALGGPAEAFAQDSDRVVVAVLPFAGPDEGDAKDLQRKIIEGMDQLGPFTLVEQGKINDRLGGENLDPGNPIPDATSLTIGRDVGARIVGRGTFEKRGDAWVAHSEFVDIGSRNTQDLGEVSDRDLEDLGEAVVEAFNDRNQADKHVIFCQDYIRSEAWERAITNCERALEYDPDLARAHYWLGQAYLRQDKLDQALAELEAAVETDPAFINAYHSIATTYLERGDTTAARGFFDELVRQKGDDCEIQIAYGYAMAQQLGATEEGLEAFEKAKQLCPDKPEAYQYTAFALPPERREEIIENLKRYLELTEGAATDPEVLQYLFSQYFALEQYEEARTTIDEALAADRDNADLQLYAGVVRSKLDNYRDAIQYYDRAIELNPENQEAYLFRAMAHRELGNQQQFARDLEKAGRGRSQDILAGIALRNGAQLVSRGRPSQALDELNRAAALGADRCAVEYYRGDAYYRLGKALEGEENSIGQNQRAQSMFREAIAHLGNVSCSRYGQYAGGLIENSNQYIDRTDKIIQKKQRTGSR